MFFAIITLITALYLAAIAAWFSIAGLLTIFSGAMIPALCMGIGIEISKVVGVSFLYRNWDNCSRILKTVTLICCVIAMILTSAGIFGFLSKAHFAQNQPIQKVQNQLQMIDMRIEREKRLISDSEVIIKQLDHTVQVLLNNEKISSKGGARDVRQSQKEERDKLNLDIQNAIGNIAKLEEDKIVLQQSITEVKVEVQVVSYLSQLLYGEDQPERAVKIMIALIMACFDPFAIVLLMCGNHLLMKRTPKKPDIEPVKEETKPEIELVSYSFTFNDVGESGDSVTLPHNDVVDVTEVFEPTETQPEQVESVSDKQDKESRLQKIRSKLKNGEIGWIPLKK